MKNHTSNSKLGVFSLAMMSVAGIFALRTLPLMAEYNLSAVFYYVLGALLFFIPSALICAELATGWPRTGGLYVWVREAFGPRFGFLAIWLEWTNTVISFPATLSFIGATIAYAVYPELAANKYYMFIMMLILFWGTTFINFLGIKFSSLASSISLILGSLFPCLLIIGLSMWWILNGHTIHLHFSTQQILSNLSIKKSSFIVGMLLGYGGMQITGFHAQETKNPQRDYPYAILIAVIIILFLSIFGSLAISAVIPQKNINIVTGIMQAAQAFFANFHMKWFVPIIAILTALGTLSMLNMWIIGPCKGLLATARYGDLPRSMQKINKHGAPTALLLSQAAAGSILSSVYLFMPTVTGSYWILIALTSLLAMLMYIMMFTAVICLRYKQPHVPRAYKIPGGKIGVWLIGGIGAIACFAAFFLGFFPPAQLNTGNIVFYESFLICGVLIISIVPFIIPIGKNQATTQSFSKGAN